MLDSQRDSPDQLDTQFFKTDKGMLVAAKAQVNQADTNGITPLLMAIANNHLDVAKFLLEKGADPNGTDWWGRAPLWAAIEIRDRDFGRNNEHDIDRDAAFDFIYWATEAAQMTQAALRGNPPTRRSVFQSPDLVKQFRAFPAQLAALEAARPRPRTTQWNEIENAFGVSLSQANSGAASPEEAMQRANREITAILERSK